MSDTIDEQQGTDIPSGIGRRAILRLGALGVAGAAVGAGRAFGTPYLNKRGMLSPDGALAATSTALADVIYLESFPTSPLILTPFIDAMHDPEGAGAGTEGRPTPAGPNRPVAAWASRTRWATSSTRSGRDKLNYPDPIVYKIDVLVRQHSFTSSKVLPIDAYGKPTVSFEPTARRSPAGTTRTLPLSTIYGFNGTFPGPHDQRRVRQARARALREPPRREPAGPGPAGLRLT